MNQPSVSFSDLGIAPKLLDILYRNKFLTPTPIQHQSIPAGIAGKDILGIAQTGTGKTLAFGLPMIQRLAQSQGKSCGLILLPTRELAVQVNDTLKKIGHSLGLKTAILIGGESMHKQLRVLAQKPHIIIATPGRLNDHLEGGRLHLNKTQILVLDEADRMLDMGFAPQIKKILDRVPKERQTMLFSATMPDQILNLARSYMQLPLRIEVAPQGTTIDLVTQELFLIDKAAKNILLQNLLNEYKGSVLVFSRTKFGAKRIASSVRAMGHTVTEIHSNRSLNQRLEALDGFKIGRFRVLVATDIAARGIDVSGIQLVINYDLPDHAADYVHRIGRTGRAGQVGHAISFATPDQKFDIRSIERLIKTTLPVSKLPALPGLQNPTGFSNHPAPFSKPDRDRHPRQNFGHSRKFHPASGSKPHSGRFSQRKRGRNPRRNSFFGGHSQGHRRSRQSSQF